MRWYIWLIIIIVIGTGSLTGGYFLGKKSCPQIGEVIDETPTENTHNQPPKDTTPNIITRAGLCAWYEECYKSDLTITGKFNEKKKNWFDVTASDPCKSAKKSFRLSMPARERKLSIQLMPFMMAGYNSTMKSADVFVGGQVSVLRNYGLFSVGGAGLYSYSLITKDHYGGAGAVFGFNP